MPQLEAKFKFFDAEGKVQEGTISEESYKAAAANGMSLSQWMTNTYETDESKYGDVMAQGLASCGFVLKEDSQRGFRPTKLSQMIGNGLSVRAGSITSPDGSGNNTPAGRLFFPEVVLQSIESQLRSDKTDFFQGFTSLIATTETVDVPEVKRPVINVTAPEGSESQPTAQLAEPAAMVTITAADRTDPIPSKGIGLMISDQAMQNSSIDLVGIAMERQAYGERVRMVEGQLADVISGNSDLGISALSSVTAQSFDSSISAAGTLTQKAWIHYLRAEYQKRSITNIICDIDTALAIEGRSNKPTNQTDDPRSPRIDSLFNVDNLGITAPNVFLVDTAVAGANTLVGLDNRFSLIRYINTSAQYDAIEAFLLRRATGFRVDYSEGVKRLYDDAFSVMTLSV